MSSARWILIYILCKSNSLSRSTWHKLSLELGWWVQHYGSWYTYYANPTHCLDQLGTSCHLNLADEFITMDPDINIMQIQLTVKSTWHKLSLELGWWVQHDGSWYTYYANPTHCLDQLGTSYHLNLDGEFITMDPDINIMQIQFTVKSTWHKLSLELGWWVQHDGSWYTYYANPTHCLDQLGTSYHLNLDGEFNRVCTCKSVSLCRSTWHKLSWTWVMSSTRRGMIYTCRSDSMPIPQLVTNIAWT